MARRALESAHPSFKPSVLFSIVLMDELDQLMTTKQDVVYNFFNWPNLAHSRLIVIAVANTHDLPERMSGKVKSRLGTRIIYFRATPSHSYRHDARHI